MEDSMSNTSKKGFASMSLEKRTAIARLGGAGVASDNRSFAKDRVLAANAGRLGGLKRVENARARKAAQDAE